MTRKLLGWAVVGAGCCTGAAHAALEPLALHDKFDAAVLDTSHWLTPLERVRQIKGGTLRLAQRDVGATSSDTGAAEATHAASLADGSKVTQLKATIRVKSYSLVDCASNPAAHAQFQARVLGSFFSSGRSTRGDLTGDVLASVRVSRDTTSTLPVDQLNVSWSSFICQDSTCSTTVPVTPYVSLGTVTLGQATTVQLEWDRAAKTFTAIRDGGTPSVQSYTMSDHGQPGAQIKQVSTRVLLPNCKTSTPARGAVDASFDDIAINRSGTP